MVSWRNCTFYLNIVHNVFTELDFRPNIYQSIDDLKTLTKEPFYCEVRDGKSTMSKDEDISNQLEASNCAAGEGECSNARESRQRGSTSTLRSTDGKNQRCFD